MIGWLIFLCFSLFRPIVERHVRHKSSSLNSLFNSIELFLKSQKTFFCLIKINDCPKFERRFFIVIRIWKGNNNRNCAEGAKEGAAAEKLFYSVYYSNENWRLFYVANLPYPWPLTTCLYHITVGQNNQEYRLKYWATHSIVHMLEWWTMSPKAVFHVM